MKKRYLGLLIIIGIGFGVITFINKKTYLSEDDVIGVYINNELSTDIPSKDSALFQKAVCDDENVSATWDSESWGLLLKNLTKKTKCNLYFYSGETVFNFDYTGTEQTFIAPVSGTYKVELWGAQGGSVEHAGGVGGYSVGYTKFNINNIKYINIGGQGNRGNYYKSEIGYGGSGGYNGGGSGGQGTAINEDSKVYYNVSGAGGGGATHLSNKSGLLKSLNNYRNDVIIVAGGGGGDAPWRSAGSAGGYKGSDVPLSYDQYGDVFPYDVFGGGQVGLDELFGQGRNATSRVVGDSWGAEGKGGGGGGYYGGEAILIDGTHTDSGGAGGSGYIGNPLLKDKVMYCYNCEESNEESTKTVSTTCAEETPTENCAKKGNGYARITLVSIDE